MNTILTILPEASSDIIITIVIQITIIIIIMEKSGSNKNNAKNGRYRVKKVELKPWAKDSWVAGF